MPLHFSGFKRTTSRFGDRFCDGQYSFVSFLFTVLLRVSRAQPFVKVRAHAPRAQFSWRNCSYIPNPRSVSV